MRRWRSTQQCLWLGSDRHCSRSRDAVTNPYPESYTIANSFTCCMRAIGHANPHAYCYSNRNRNSHGYGNGYSDCDSNSNGKLNTQTDADAEICADTETSSYSSAETIRVSPKRNFVVIRDR